MNKAELVYEMAALTGINKKKANKVLDVFIKTVTEELVAGNKVCISGFGHFEVALRAPKIGRNPKTKVEVPIPAEMKAKFKSSKKFINAVDI